LEPEGCPGARIANDGAGESASTNLIRDERRASTPVWNHERVRLFDSASTEPREPVWRLFVAMQLSVLPATEQMIRKIRGVSAGIAIRVGVRTIQLVS
jgi:hypothetical protein